MKGRNAALAFLAAVHLIALGAGVLAPYSPLEQNRTMPYAPPTRLRFVDDDGGFHLRPFVYPFAETADGADYVEDRTRPFPVRFMVAGAPYTVAGVRGRTHLFGVDEPARAFLLGTDGLGRDQLSRLLHGALVSLLAGLLAAALSLALGWVLGMAAGFYGGWVDTALMRGADVLLALPWLYLLLAVRAALPLHVPPAQAFLTVVVVVGILDCARPARLLRGVVLSLRERNFVLAARGFGASDLHLVRRHIAPHTLGLVLTQAALLAPQYVLAEVTLSFLGLGVSEPAPSLGNMLAALQQYHVLAGYWWMWAPGLALVPVFLAYFVLSEAISPADAST